MQSATARRAVARCGAVSTCSVASAPVEAVIGVGEQAKPFLGLQHAATGGVDERDVDQPLGDRRFQRVEIGLGHHVAVNAGLDGPVGGAGLVGGEAVGDQFLDAGVVGHHQAVEAEALPQPRC